MLGDVNMSLYHLQKKSTPCITENWQDKALNEKEGKVILQPVTNRIPNEYNIYSPSKLRSKKEVTYEEFLSQYAQEPRGIRVCFDESLPSDSMLQRFRH